MVAIHQTPFLTALAEKNDVSLVVEDSVYLERKKQGWNMPDIGNIHLHIAPNYRELESMLDDSCDSIHIFSSIYAYRTVYKAFRLACKRRYHIIVMMEPYDNNGLKGVIRRIVWVLMRLLYGRFIQAILPTGQLGLFAYKKSGFNPKKMFEWGYFTSSSNHNICPHSDTLPHVIFVGQLIERKNILTFLEVAKQNQDLFAKLYIVGDGPLKDSVLSIIKEIPHAIYLANKDNQETRKLMSECDLLVLPSLFDGWGAVVNEALQEGCVVLCSSACGSASLLDGEKRGGIFHLGGQDDMSQQLKYWLSKVPLLPERKKAIKEWAGKCISGHAAAQYFEEIIAHVYAHAKSPSPPWRGGEL